MALNVKAALLICTGFVTSLCWLISQVALPVPTVAPPSGPRPEMTTPAKSDTRGTVAAAASAAGPGAAQPFVRQNPFESQAAANRQAGERLSLAAVPQSTSKTHAVALPPLAHPQTGADVLASASPELIDSKIADSASLAETGSGEAARPGADVKRTEGTERPAEAAGTVVGTDGPGAADGPAQPRHYQARKGDSLTKIAQREMNSADARVIKLLIEANPKLRARPNRVRAGEQLVIPDTTVVARVLRGEEPAKALAEARRSAPAMASGNAATASAKAPAPKGAASDGRGSKETATAVATARPGDARKAQTGGRGAKGIATAAKTTKPAEGKTAPPEGYGSKAVAKAAALEKAAEPEGKPAADRADKTASTAAPSNARTAAGSAGSADPSAGRRQALVKVQPPEAKAEPPDPKDKKALAAAAATPPRETPKSRYYTIQERDSLTGIAERYLNDPRRWREIASINGLDEPNKIAPGTRIKLPGALAE
jgi:nucleoid-associated protein YgaU